VPNVIILILFYQAISIQREATLVFI